MNRTYRILTAVLILVAMVGLTATGAAHAERRTGEEVVVAAGEVVADDLYVAASNIVIDGVVKGDVIAFGRSIVINGVVEGDLLGAAQVIGINGSVGDDARIAAQAIVIGPSGSIGDDANVAAYSFEAKPESRVGGDLWVAASQVLLAGDIVGDVLGGGEGVSIAGTVGGDVQVGVADSEPIPGFSYAQFMPALPDGFYLPNVSRGLTIAEGARIAGDLTYTSRSEVTVPGGAVGGSIVHQLPEVPRTEATAAPAEFGSGAWAIEQVQRLLRLLLVGLLLVWLAGGWLRRISEALRARPLPSLGWGVLSPFALLAFVVIAAVVIVIVAALLSYIFGSVALIALLLSSAAGTIVVIYLMLAFYIGALAAAYALGERILPGGQSLWAMLIGAGILWLLTLIPIVGTIIGIVFALFGLGAIWLAVRRRGGEPALAQPATVA
jgi:cytoskeletal protein CcmA (bactofilin family)